MLEALNLLVGLINVGVALWIYVTVFIGCLLDYTGWRKKFFWGSLGIIAANLLAAWLNFRLI